MSMHQLASQRMKGQENATKSEFEVSENSIKRVLPVLQDNLSLSADEKKLYDLLSKNTLKPISNIAPYAPFGKSKVLQLLKSMEQKGIVTIEGKGRGTKYIIK